MGLRIVGKMISDGHTYVKYVLRIPFVGEFRFRIKFKNKLKTTI